LFFNGALEIVLLTEEPFILFIIYVYRFMNGQVSVEMLIVVGLGIAIVGIYTIYGYNSVDAYQKGNDGFLMKDSLEKISETAKFVANQGEPAKQQINVCFPISLDNCSISTGTITCFLRKDQRIEQDVGVMINGSLPTTSGCWDISVQATSSGYVNLSIS
jgi:hypothetical protein